MRPAENVLPAESHEHGLHVRVYTEFMEMPGLKLTIPQASRLFALDAACCERVLGTLVACGALSAAGGAFMRADSGRRQA